MNSKKYNKICVFPDTMPREEILFPLVQVFEQVVYLRPVENDTPELDTYTSFCKKAVEADRLTFDCPAPLGDNRDRFLQLVKDLQNRPDDYASQLSSLSLAGLGRHNDSESKTTIISTLFKSEGGEDKQNEQRNMVLWQARLVLALGEIFDRSQASLQKNLAQISAREQGLLDELREDNQQPFALTKDLSAQNEKTDKQLRLRMKAWSRLFGLGSNQSPCSLFVTANNDAFDLLLEQYESEQKKPPVKLIDLMLPVLSNSQPFKKITAFKDEAKSLLNSILEFNSSPSQNEEELRASWAEMVDNHYPPAEHPRCMLSLYTFSGITGQKLFLETFGRDENSIQFEANAASSTTPEAIIGILQPYKEDL
jgi:hypothetical protein